MNSLLAIWLVASPTGEVLPTLELELSERPTRLEVERSVDALTSSPAWLRQDPTWQHVRRSTSRALRVGDHQVVRVTPFLASKYGPLPVEGADRVITARGAQVLRTKIGAPLAVRSQFRLGPNQALRAASAIVPGSLLRKPRADQGEGLARPVFVAHGDRIRAAWRVRVPTVRLEQLSDVWIDAETGEVLRRAPTAKFAREVRP